VDFRFTEEQEMLRETIRRMMEKEATPEYIRRLDREQEYPYALYDRWVELGLFRMPFPEEFGGLGGSVLDMAVIAEELSRKSFDFFTAFGGSVFCGLTVARKGTDAQRHRWLPKLLWGEIRMSVSMSEPDAGSDVGAMRTTARRDGDHWVINGQKVWTSGAHYSDFGILLVRTNPKVPKHKGLTMFIVNMKQPGVEVRPIHQASGGREFNEVYFTDVRIPDTDRLGAVGDGWKVALVTLMNERLAVGGSPGPDWGEIMAYAQQSGTMKDQAFREKLADWYVAAQGYKLTKFRTQTALSRGQTPGPENSIGKIITANHLQDICNSAIELQDHYGIMTDAERMPADAIFQQSFMWAPGLRIAGGTDEILKNIIAERVLGLPQDVRVDKDLAFDEMKAG